MLTKGVYDPDFSAHAQFRVDEDVSALSPNTINNTIKDTQ